MSKQSFKRYAALVLLGALSVPAYFFLYDLPQKWIVLAAFTFGLLIVAIILYIAKRRAAANPGLMEPLSDQAPYIEVMAMGVVIMSVAVYTLIGIGFGLITHLEISPSDFKYYFWILLCAYVILAGYSLYRFKSAARYMLSALAILALSLAVLTIGYLFIQGDHKAAFGFLILTNMNIMGLWFWAIVLIYIWQPKTIQTLRDYNENKGAGFDPTHIAVMGAKNTMLKGMIAVILFASVKFGIAMRNNQQLNVSGEGNIKRQSETYTSPENFKRIEKNLRLDQLKI